MRFHLIKSPAGGIGPPRQLLLRLDDIAPPFTNALGFRRREFYGEVEGRVWVIKKGGKVLLITAEC